jgi:methionyl-tRNA synthetase
MSNAPSKFYITTAIDYPNSVPHMGHAYEKVVADFYARANRLRGTKIRFLIGLDEHGQKIQQAADKAGKSPQEFVDEKAEAFRDLYRLLDISYDDFIRTSEPRHRSFAAELYEAARRRGDVYKGFYEGDYCVSCEKAYTKSELVSGKCPIHDTPTTVVREESYFFKLGKYSDAVRSHIQTHPDFILPAERRNEILSRLGDEVLDLSISRSTFQWGVPLPNDSSHVLYVWFDALANYMSALRQPQDVFREYWPADCHVIGKDIIWFHTVIWPAMLLSAELELPRQVYAHGFILDKDGRKMSKHLGNVIDPLAVIEEYSVDVLRFYFLRTFSSGLDGKFSLEELEERYQSELGNDLGNLVLRIAKLIESRLGGSIATSGHPGDLDPAGTIRDYFQLVDAREHSRCIEALWTYVRRTNAYLNEKQPWKAASGPELERTLATSLEAMRVIAHLAEPILPATARAIGASFGFDISSVAALFAGPRTYRVTLGKPLFPRREKPPREAGATGTGGASALAAGPKPGEGPRDPFSKLDLRVGRIEEVREHPNADALFAMTIDLGTEKRSICAGLRQHLRAEDLLGRKVLVLANLKPAMLRGVESAGMILAADRKDGKVAPVEPGAANPGDGATVEGIVSAPKSKVSISDFEKAPLTIQSGQVTYAGKPIRTTSGPVTCDAEDGARVR